MDFLKKLPDGTITQDNVQSYGEDAYLHTGMYTFQTGPEGNRQPVEARFSYMWRKVDGDWKIVHHHSSALPKQAATAEVELSSEDMYPIAQASQASSSRVGSTRWFCREFAQSDCLPNHSAILTYMSQDNFKRWNDALVEKDYEKVASLYSSTDLSFLPTVSPKFIRDGQSTREYFINFLKKLPEGTITQDNVQKYGSDAYLHTGLYTFQTGPEGNRQPVEARFSYMWRKIDGVWKITHHHSSALPKDPAAAVEEVQAEDMYPVAQVCRPASCRQRKRPLSSA